MGGSLGEPEVVERPSRRAGSGQEARAQGRHWLVALLEGREALLKKREWSGDPPGGPGVVGRPSRRAGSGQEALLDGRELSGSPPRRT